MSEEKALTEMIGDLVDKGATTAEEIHREIAELPISALDSLGIFQNSTDDIRKLQDRSIGAIYGAIRSINQKVTKLAEEVLEQASNAAASLGEDDEE